MHRLLKQAGLALMGLAVFASAQVSVGLDYASPHGGFEVNLGNALPYLWSVSPTLETLASEGVAIRTTATNTFRGSWALQIDINRAATTALDIRLTAPIIHGEYLMPLVIPPDGTPLLMRIRMKSENLQGVQVSVWMLSGERYTQAVSSIPSNTFGWQTYSAVVPLERNRTGHPVMSIVIRIDVLPGTATGRLCIDELEAIWGTYQMHLNRPPNPIKFYAIDRNAWTEFIRYPADFVLSENPANLVALKKHRPGLPSALYFNLAHVYRSTSPKWYDLYNSYDFVQQNHPDWFLMRNEAGNPMPNPGYLDHYPIDIGIPSAQDYAISRWNDIRLRIPLSEWVLLDDAWWRWFVIGGVNRTGGRYTTPEDMIPAWRSFLNRLLPLLREQGYKISVNAGSTMGSVLDNNHWTQFMQYLDGFMNEHAFTYTRVNNGVREYLYQPYRYRDNPPLSWGDHSWWATLRAVTEYPNKKIFLVAMSDYRNRDMIRYILASYFVVAHENTYLSIDSRQSNNSLRHWLDIPECWVPLGQPLRSWYTAAGTASNRSGALFARDFEYGIVLVNPTETQTYEYTLPRAYKNWDGQVVPAGTRIQIGPKTGLAFYAAPEIRISISPQQITALPGETVTFTVQYRNDGLADGTNIKISVPLPEGLEFVSSSTGGQFLNRQITWTLPQVRAGQSGTLTFQARVQ